MARSPAEVYLRYIQPFTMPSARALIASLSLKGDERVLDHGSGTGLLVRLLHAKYPRLRVVALDPSADLLAGLSVATLGPEAHLEKWCATAEQVIADPSVVSYNGTKFDAIISNYSLPFCGDPVAELTRLHAFASSDTQLRVAVLGAARDVVPFHLFWSAVHAVIPGAAKSDAYVHHSLGDPVGLAHAAKAAGWAHVSVTTEIAERTMTSEGAWEWLNRVLPVMVDGSYRALTKSERARVKSHFLPTWPANTPVASTYHRLSAN
jgi:SAM-dependent methyltransferase